MPVVADNVLPSISEPITVGSAVLTGGAIGATVPVAAELALVEPPALVAVTRTRNL